MALCLTPGAGSVEDDRGRSDEPDALRSWKCDQPFGTARNSTVATPTRPWSVKHYTILIALVLALTAGMFAVYLLTGADVATTAAKPAMSEQVRWWRLQRQLHGRGGLVEGQSAGDTCGAAGGSGIRGGVQP